MEDKIYKTPNGKTFEETYLRERYGDKFGLLVATGQFEQIEGGTIEDEVQLEEEIYLAPNGKEFMTSELIEKYGPDGFEKIKDPKEYLDKLNFHRKLNSFKDYS